MRVMITGVAGFIGSSLAVRLVKDGDEVSGIDNLSARRTFPLACFSTGRTSARGASTPSSAHSGAGETETGNATATNVTIDYRDELTIDYRDHAQRPERAGRPRDGSPPRHRRRLTARPGAPGLVLIPSSVKRRRR